MGRSDEIVVSLKNVSKTYMVRDKNNDSIRDKVLNVFKINKKRQIHALKDVNLEVRRGEFIGIIGHNGSGKSTLLNIIMGSLPADKGSKIEVHGRMMRLALGMGFDANLTARENIYVNGSVLGLTFREIDERFDEIIHFAELKDFVNTKVKFFSKGMRGRLAFAVAVHAETDIFLFDEFFGGIGDINFKKKSEEVFEQSLVEGRTIILVSHNLDVIEKRSDRVLLLNKGEVVMLGDPNEALMTYKEIARKEREKQKKRK